MLRRAAVAAVVSVGSIAGVVGTAHANGTTGGGLTCGEVLTQSVTLHADLTCAGPVFQLASPPLAAPNPIVVDLAGHTITSTSGLATVFVDGAPTMTLEHGRVAGPGVIELSAAHNTYTDLTFTGAGGGVKSSSNASPTFTYDRFVNGASLSANETAVDIEHSTFIGGATGTAMDLGFTYATLVGNRITGFATAISIHDIASSADVRNNLIVRSGRGIVVGGFGSDTVPGILTGNMVIASRGDGIVLGDGSGIGTAPAFPVAGMTVSRNAVVANGGDGIHVVPGTSTLGVDVTLTANLALGNGGYGIAAPPPAPGIVVTDGGGNVAHGNRGPAQCLTIMCIP